MASKVLNSSHSTGSLRSRENASARTLTPTHSVERLDQQPGGVLASHICQSPDARLSLQTAKLEEAIQRLGDEHGSLHNSLSAGSIISVGSDGATPPLGPPRSTPVEPGTITAMTEQNQWSKVHRLQNPQRTGTQLDWTHQPAATGQAPAMPHGIASEMHPSHDPAPRSPRGPMWVIEEVIDFQVPMDDGIVYEVTDGLPPECKNASGSATDNLFFAGCYSNRCVRAMCPRNTATRMPQPPSTSTRTEV